MTLEQLKAKREQILKSLGLAGVRSGEDGVSFGADSEKLAALAKLESEIRALESPQPRQFTVQTNRGISE